MKAVFGVIFLAFVLAGCSGRFVEFAASNRIDASPDRGGFGVTFFGTSTLLVDDGDTQILIDGFVTRKRHNFIRRIEPSEPQIQEAIAAHRICPAPGRTAVRSRPDHCANNPKRGLALVIPAHAHYDHALDSAYFAAWAGTRLVADPSIVATFDATRARPWKTPMHWQSVEFIPPFASPDRNTRRLRVGNFTVTLIRSHHLENPLSQLAGRETSRDLSLPAHLWEFGEGTTLAIRIERGGRSILIVPSAGLPVEPLEAGEYRSDVVFMGIGGLGWKPLAERESYWNSLITATGARRVVPIHWDNDQAELSTVEANFRPSPALRLDATLKVFERLAERDNVELAVAPPRKRFDPFNGL